MNKAGLKVRFQGVAKFFVGTSVGIYHLYTNKYLYNSII
jgi:hypothetical protein